MRNRSILLLLSLLALTLGPAWAPAGSEAGTRATVERVRTIERLRTVVERTQPTAKSIVREPIRTAFISAEPLPDYALYLPSNATERPPMRILVALHGMGGSGPEFAKSLLGLAERHGWAVLAPTMPYRDFRDPSLVRQDAELLPRLKALLDVLPARTGLSFQPQVLFYGFSRGSQEAHRFALMYPETTLGVAGMSAGSYTLPLRTIRQTAQAAEQMLSYPFGTGDVDQICGRAFNAEAARNVSFWIAVGGRDNRFEDVPRQWDPYVGTTRVERAQRFVTALQQFGAPAQLAIFPGAGHEVTDQMRDDAFRFLASIASPAAVS